MRRAKDHCGKPKPLTWTDIREVQRFELWLRRTKELKAAGVHPPLAGHKAHLEVYPEQEPN